MMDIEEMGHRLKAEFPDAEIKLQDLTGGGDHIVVEIATVAFAGLSRLKQHKAVMAVFDEELKSGKLHALSIKSKVKEANTED